jgi:hypothetical protein
MKTLLLLSLSTLLLFSCNSVTSDQESALKLKSRPFTSSPKDAMDDTPVNNQAEDNEAQPENNQVPLSSSQFKFSLLNGDCLDSNQVQGFNIGLLDECGDLSYETLENKDLTKKIYGLNLKGAKILSSKMNFKRLAYSEVLFSLDTEFPQRFKAPFLKLAKGHIKAHRKQKERLEKKQNAIKRKRKKISKLKVRHKRTQDPEKKQMLRARILNLRQDIRNLKSDRKIAGQKRRRHKNFYKWSKKAHKKTISL